MTKVEIVEKIKELSKADADLDFLLGLKKVELQTLSTCFRNRVKELEKELVEHNWAEEEASFEQNLLQTLLNNIPAYVYFKDRDRRFVLASNLFCDLFDRNMEDIIGKKDEDLFPEEVAEKTVMDDREVIETGKPIINKEEGGESIGGEEPWVLTTKVPWYDREGNIIGLFGISKEITERKRAEEALKESEVKARALLNAPTELMLLTELNGTIIDINDAGAEMLGVSRNKLIGTCAFDLFPPDVAQKRKTMGEKAINSEKPLRFVDERNGRWFDQQVYPILDTQLEVPRLAIYVQDITEMKQTEEALRTRERELENKTRNLEEVNTALNVLLTRKEEDKIEIEEKVLSNVKELVEPYLEKLRNSDLNERQMTYADIVESNIEEIISPFIHRLSSKYLNFTPTEIKIANLIRQGRRTKDIADLLDLSPRTIKFHRENIRKKIGIKNNKINLRSHLMSLQ